MPNAIKYSATAQSKALKKGNFHIGTGDDPKGNTPVSEYWNGISPPIGGYTIYLNKASQGPSIYVAANDAELISLTNRIAGTSYTTVGECLTWFSTQTDKMVLNKDYELISTDGLVLNLDAGFTPCYPKTGTTSYDISPAGNNGSLINGVLYNSDGWSFDGSNDYINIPFSSTMNFSLAQTICIWMKPSTGASNARRNPYNQAYGGSGTLTHEPNGTINYYFGTNGGNNTPYVGIGSGFTVVANETAFITVTRDQTLNTCKWYKNSVLYTNTSAGSYVSTANGNSPITIGSGYAGTFIGDIFNVIVYNRSLSQNEISTIYNSTKTRFGL